AATLREQIGIPMPPNARARLDSVLLMARQALGEQTAKKVEVAGRAMSMDEAIAEALSPAESPDAGKSRVGQSAVLTRREREVAVLIARGHTNRQIAAELIIAEGTAANHVVHILDKLGYNARSQIAVWAAEHGLLASDDQRSSEGSTASRGS
ncbi:MAG TPA: LuxR C-terminal-related transcriptional regulator, partial [Chloroflexota bacterium]|nr:LuxR C-terminal-related transcriptional regulator [Chloroflexota bacterium]